MAVILASFRALRIPRTAFARPYVMMSVLFTAPFCYLFAALGNQGLITREATVVLPFFLVPLLTAYHRAEGHGAIAGPSGPG